MSIALEVVINKSACLTLSKRRAKMTGSGFFITEELQES
jgi:hypothetical protein